MPVDSLCFNRRVIWEPEKPVILDVYARSTPFAFLLRSKYLNLSTILLIQRYFSERDTPLNFNLAEPAKNFSTCASVWMASSSISAIISANYERNPRFLQAQDYFMLMLRWKQPVFHAHVVLDNSVTYIYVRKFYIITAALFSSCRPVF